ncbi:MAG: CBS domain-containing protein [Microcoleaceae cyanobacterium]
MQFAGFPISALSPDVAINPHPLTVTPDTSLQDAIALLSKVADSCTLPNLFGDSPPILTHPPTSVLVVEEKEVIGIITQRDFVRFVAQGMLLESVKVASVMTQPVVTLKAEEFRNFFIALNLFRQYRIRHLPIIDDRNKLIGIVTPESIRQVIQPHDLLRWRRVDEVMVTSVIYTFPDTSVKDLANLMTEHHVSSVIICQSNLSQSNEPVIPLGIITEKDIIHFHGLNLNLQEVKTSTVMSSPLFTLTPEDCLWFAHQQMLALGVSRLVVTGSQGELLGILTQTNLLQALDPMEMYNIIRLLEQEVTNQMTLVNSLQQEKMKLLDNRSHLLENRVNEQIESLKIETMNCINALETMRKKEIKLQTDVNLLEGILATIDSFVIVLDLQGNFVRINDPFEQLLGYASGELLGRFWGDFFANSDAREQLKVIFQMGFTMGLKEKNYIFSLKQLWVNQSGEPHLIYWSNKPLLNGEGKPEYIVGTGQEMRREGIKI